MMIVNWWWFDDDGGTDDTVSYFCIKCWRILFIDIGSGS